jgi:hypothetical protein
MRAPRFWSIVTFLVFFLVCSASVFAQDSAKGEAGSVQVRAIVVVASNRCFAQPENDFNLSIIYAEILFV